MFVQYRNLARKLYPLLPTATNMNNAPAAIKDLWTALGGRIDQIAFPKPLPRISTTRPRSPGQIPAPPAIPRADLTSPTSDDVSSLCRGLPEACSVISNGSRQVSSSSGVATSSSQRQPSTLPSQSVSAGSSSDQSSAAVSTGPPLALPSSQGKDLSLPKEVARNDSLEVNVLLNIPLVPRPSDYDILVFLLVFSILYPQTCQRTWSDNFTHARRLLTMILCNHGDLGPLHCPPRNLNPEQYGVVLRAWESTSSLTSLSTGNRPSPDIISRLLRLLPAYILPKDLHGYRSRDLARLVPDAQVKPWWILWKSDQQTVGAWAYVVRVTDCNITLIDPGTIDMNSRIIKICVCDDCS